MASYRHRRRVITGIDEQGRSCVWFDGLIPMDSPARSVIWRTAEIPADNAYAKDGALLPGQAGHGQDRGSRFTVSDYPPTMQSRWHSTNTIDYLVVLDGALELQLETGSVVVEAGDMIVDRGVIHAWRTLNSAPATMVTVMLPGIPLFAADHDEAQLAQLPFPPSTAPRRVPGGRRIVTGQDAAGKSRVLIDGSVVRRDGSQLSLVWSTPALPADNFGTEDVRLPADLADLRRSAGSNFLQMDLPTGYVSKAWQKANMIEYVTVIQGEVVLELEASHVSVCAGDFIVVRGVRHRWRNPGSVPVRLAIATVPALAG